MTFEQIVVFSVLIAAMVLFIWGRWRYDLVALLALLAAVLAGVVPADHAFMGFGHPAVITVGAVLIISRALQVSGIVDFLVGLLGPTGRTTTLQVGATSGLGMVFSAFMNNIGALALMLPVALRHAARAGRSPSTILMPLSFATLLGGLVTLIGTPPNIIIASFRAEYSGESFGMFDFTAVGLPVALAGLAFVSLVGWRLLPQKSSPVGDIAQSARFHIEAYLIEARVPEKSTLIRSEIRQLEALCQNEVTVMTIIRGRTRILAPHGADSIQAGDLLILEGDPVALKPLFGSAKLEAISDVDIQAEELRSDAIDMAEVVVMPNAAIEGQSMRGLKMHERYGVNLLALARADRKPETRLGSIRFRSGDVLLLQGEEEHLHEVTKALGCLPLADRELHHITRRRKVLLAPTIFGLAILAAAFGFLAIPVAFVSAVVGLVLTNCLTLREAYDSIEWPVIVLLGALLPLGGALQSTGGTTLIADGILGLSGDLPTWALLAILMAASMLLADLIHNSPTAVLMAPVSVGIAAGLGLPADPFLMAVAVGSASPYLTPIGHQSNTLVMAPGGYQFRDYWRMGLPLDLIILCIAVPLIYWVWMP
jgi:di/tricarboxylate transporter